MENKIPGLTDSIGLGPIGLSLKNELEVHLKELDHGKQGPTDPVVKLASEYKMNIGTLVELTQLAVTTSVAIGSSFTDLAAKLGKDIWNYYKISEITKKIVVNKEGEEEEKLIRIRPTAVRLRLGAFIIDGFVRKGLVVPKLIKMKSNNKGQKTVWMLYAKDRAKLEKLRKEFPRVDNSHYVLDKQATSWSDGFSKNEKGESVQLIRGVDFKTASKIGETQTPILLNAINKKQAVEYSICSETYDVFKWCFETEQKVFDFFHNKFMNADARKSKEGQNHMLMHLANDILSKENNSFFQRYFCDFRGRIYPESKYLNEIGTDSAKGLLKIKNGAPLGDTGLNYLYHHIANCYGFDKESHEAKVEFVKDNYYRLILWGRNPKVFTGWMSKDAPFQLLNSCFELQRLDNWLRDGNSVESFVSNTICYFDGSNNGAQWLFALAKDAKNSHLVNVIMSPDGKFGDFYKYVGNRVFDKIKNTNVTAEETHNFNKYLKHMFRRRKQWRDIYDKLFHATGDKNNLKQQEQIVKDKLSKFQAKYKDKLTSTNTLYWQNAIDQGIMTPKEFRTIVKRPCMTFAYSGTVRGFAQQILDDSDQFENEYIQNKQFSACFMLAQMIYDTIEEDFPELVSIRNYLTEVAGKYIDNTGRNLEFNTVISGFPFTNGYYKAKTDHINLKFYAYDNLGNLEYARREIEYETDTFEVDKRKSKLGISPNFVHQLDALHLQLVVEACQFDIVSAHDSYGSLASNAEVLNRTIREQMVRVLEADPIKKLSNDTGDLVELPLTGDLDINEILKSDFAFA